MLGLLWLEKCREMIDVCIDGSEELSGDLLSISEYVYVLSKGTRVSASSVRVAFPKGLCWSHFQTSMKEISLAKRPCYPVIGSNKTMRFVCD
jgi:hypothetical protein